MQEQILEPTADRSLAGQIARTLADRIVSGVIAPGARLRQDHIASEFQASHVPVREAFRRLEAQGLVRNEPRRGVSVLPLEPDAIIEITEMRAALEGLALRHALPRIGPAELTEAHAAIAEGEASTELAIWEAANRRFHRALIGACVMPKLLATIDDLHRAGARFLLATWRELDWQPRSEQEHRAILAAVERQDLAEASRLLGDHIHSAGRALVARIQGGRTGPGEE